jgi:drug/metabolite transporter (DMT)-like permease
MAICAGILIQLSQALYFKALSFSEAGIVAAYWNLVPAFLPIVSYLALGTIFSGRELLGIIILVSTSVALCILDANFETRWKSFFLMTAAASLQVIAYIFEDVIFSKSAFFPAFFLITFGLIITGMIPLGYKKVRHTLRRNTKKLMPLIKFFLVIEIFNLIALFFAQKGIATGDAALVAAIETTMPAHAFLLSAVLVFALPSLSNRDVLYKLPQKLIAVGVMIVGVYFVS